MLRYKWMDAVFPYVTSEVVFNCPSHSKYSWAYSAPGGPYKFRSRNSFGSYAINVSYWGEPGFEQSPAGEESTGLASLQDASGCVWIGESSAHSEFAWQDKSDQPSVVDDSPRWLDYLIERHLGTAPVLYCDGHVKPMRLDALTRKNAAGAYPAFTIQADDA